MIGGIAARLLRGRWQHISHFGSHHFSILSEARPPMNAEHEKLVGDIEQSLALLRRSL